MKTPKTKQNATVDVTAGISSPEEVVTSPMLRKKKLAIVTFKFVETHPRVNRLANTFKECDYDVTVYGLSHKPNISTNSNGIKFITFPMRSTVRSKFTNLVLFPVRLVMGTIAALTLVYCRIRKI